MATLRREGKAPPYHTSYYKEAMDKLQQAILDTVTSKNDKGIDAVMQRWKARSVIHHAESDPTDFFDSDGPLHGSGDEADDQDEAETPSHQSMLTEIRQQEEDSESLDPKLSRLAEDIPKSFFPTGNLSPDVEHVIRDDDDTQEMPVEEKKRKVLSTPGGVADWSLEQMTEYFSVTPHFIADVLAKHGADCPVLKDVPLRSLVDVAIIWDMLEYLNIMDPMDIEDCYPIETIDILAEEYGCSTAEVIKLCKILEIKLPFGSQSRVNVECYDVLTRELRALHRARRRLHRQQQKSLT
eukprot:GHVT01067778.1.p3 GENE.GHVT01067778.1~~GHVT01067778.1.p3  ORF type:complete len:296 (+),score=48.79 GHVT01067778.1:9185-10072(+)